MRAFKKDIFDSNLFSIDFSFIMSNPNTRAHFLNPFLAESSYCEI